MFGALILGIVFYALHAIISFPFLDTPLGTFGIAALNTVFRLATVLLLAPCTGLLEKLTCGIIRESQDEADRSGPTFEDRFIPYPALALEQCQNAIQKMAELTQQSMLGAIGTVRMYDQNAEENVETLEAMIDKYEDALGTYILKVTKGELNTKQSHVFTKFLHTITDLERISDHALNIAQIARRMDAEGVSFSGITRQELDVLQSALEDILRMTTDSFVRDDVASAMHVDPLEEVIDELCERMKDRHIERMKAGECTLAQGVALNELLTNYERVSDHCSNIALAMIEVERNDLQLHAYQFAEESGSDADYHRSYEIFREKYALPD